MLNSGDIVSYYYLWARQSDAGEESGRKARPVCVVVRTPVEPAHLFLFPLTSQKPASEHAALAVSEIECKRGGLGYPCWLILDEFNRTRADQAYDLGSASPTGSFSQAFVRKIAGSIKELAARQDVRSVNR